MTTFFKKIPAKDFTAEFHKIKINTNFCSIAPENRIFKTHPMRPALPLKQTGQRQ